MKVLIAYHSRSHNNEKVAKELAERLHADLEPIIGKRNGELKGPGEFMKEGIVSGLHLKSKINPQSKEPSLYDLTIICTPIRAGNLPGQIRTYISNNAFRFNNIAYVSACAAEHNPSAIKEIERITGLIPNPVLEIQVTSSNIPKSKIALPTWTDNEFNDNEIQAKINQIVENITKRFDYL